jgi:copper type II ascorbate-dependent monooxygenase-like protein
MGQSERLFVASLFAFSFLGAIGSLGCSAGHSGPKSTGTAGNMTPAGDMMTGGGTATSGTPGRGCGQGTSCAEADDLPVPSADQGFQIATPPNQIVVQPGAEAFLCFYKNIPVSSDVNVGKMQSWMTPGSSHHFIAFQTGSGASGGGFGGFGGFGGGAQPDGTLSSCGLGAGGQWVFATSVPGKEIELKMPDGVGLPFAATTQIVLNMHFINPGATTAYPQVKMNFLYAQNFQYQAAPMVSFNTTINIPPAAADGTPGTQTVSGTCSAPAGAQFFLMTSHTHKHATVTDVNYISGGQTMNIVHTTDWENPDVGLWSAPDYLTVQQGDSFTYSCTYENTATTAVTVGETAASNEMCMAIGYYFPATVGRASCR